MVKVNDVEDDTSSDCGGDQCYFGSLNHFYSTSNTIPNTVFYFHF